MDNTPVMGTWEEVNRFKEIDDFFKKEFGVDLKNPYDYLYFVFFKGNKKETDKFLAWALGKNYKKYSVSDTPKLWNARHGKKLKLNADHDIVLTMMDMVKIYRKENERTNG